MKNIVLAFALTITATIAAQAQNAPPKPPPTTLRGVLLEQLRTTHNSQDWFASGNTAIAGSPADTNNTAHPASRSATSLR